MKKFGKVLAVLSIASIATAGVASLAACGDKTSTGEAWAMVHSAGSYVGYSTVKVTGKGEDIKIKDVTLTEVCLPNHVKYETGEKDDKGNDIKANYAKVTYSGVTMTWDDVTGNYKVGNLTAVQYYASEANCKAYYEAVVGNKITAYKTADGAADTTAMTYKTLSKEENGYWNSKGPSIIDPIDGSWWKANRDATVNYVKKNGIEGLMTLEKNSDGYWADENGVSTGATWNDLSSDNGMITSSGSVTYAGLIMTASLMAASDVYTGEYKYDVTYGTTTSTYGVKVHVAVYEGRIVRVTYDADTDAMHNITPSWAAHDVTAVNLDIYLTKFVGKTVAEVKALNVTTDEKGIPQSADLVFDNLTYEDETKDPTTVTTGATQTAGRFILAIQNALKNV